MGYKFKTETKRLKIGKKIGKITIQKRLSQFNWKCKCNCGKESIKTSNALYQGLKKENYSCGCSQYQYKKGANHFLWNGIGEMSGKKWQMCLANAKNRNIPFLLSKEEAWGKYLEQNSSCALTKEKLSFGKDSVDVSGTASIDRINSQVGYQKDNIQWVHKIVNQMKWDLDQEIFLNYCNLLTHPLKGLPSKDCNITKKYCNWKGCGNVSGHLFARIKQNAKTRKINFNISIEDLWDLFLKQNGRCHLTGLELFIEKEPKQTSESRITASLDRIDSNQPYELSNIQWVHKDINQKIKKTLNEKEIKYWAKRIHDHENKKNK